MKQVRGFGKGQFRLGVPALTAFAVLGILAWWLFWPNSEQRAVKVALESARSAAEQGSQSELLKWLAADYADEWGQSRQEAADRAIEVLLDAGRPTIQFRSPKVELLAEPGQARTTFGLEVPESAQQEPALRALGAGWKLTLHWVKRSNGWRIKGAQSEGRWGW